MFKRLFEKLQTEEACKPATKRTMALSILSIVAVSAVLTIAVTAFVTNAWYARNRIVDASETSIDTDQAPTSLFISAGDSIDHNWNVSLTAATSARLYPISTVDCVNWYYASAWGHGVFSNGVGWSAGNAGDTKLPYVTGFSAATVSVSNRIGTYDNALDGTGKVAYVKDTYQIYTNQDSLNVYLNPTNPIVVSGSGADNLKNALRIGVFAGNTLKFIYAPVDETGHGNCAGVVSNGAYYGVNGTSTASPLTTVLHGTATTALAAYLADSTVGADGSYTATSHPNGALGTAGKTNGLPITVYIWLEGTDANAMAGQSDTISGTLSVTLNLVGVEPST